MGSQKVDLSLLDTDIDGGRFRVSALNENSDNGGASALVSVSEQSVIDPENDKRTVREALRFFFSPEGDVFREFMLEEVVTVVDASSREVTQELAKSLGLNNFPLPGSGLLRALNPKLTEKDRKVSNGVQQTRLFC